MPGLCQIVFTVGLLPGVAVLLPAVRDPLFALSPVEELNGTDAEVGSCSRCSAWDGGCDREIVNDWTIYELTIYKLIMVVVYMFLLMFCCVYSVVRVYPGLPP